ncbi:hypothetical protein [Paeniglutamicibacter sp.]|uniref:hypothetical protein n=1 Tax=Paeniglutamicibacter sp. TaxID=1934391 RepID=UPI00398A0BA4
MQHNELHDTNCAVESSSAERRTIIKGAVWSLPVTSLAVAAPSAAAGLPARVVPAGNNLQFNPTNYSIPGVWDTTCLCEPMMNASNKRDVTTTTCISYIGALNFLPGEFTVSYRVGGWFDLRAGKCCSPIGSC